MVAPATTKPLRLPRRLDKFLRDGTNLSVAEIRAAWSAGRVRVRSADPGCGHDLADRVFPGDFVYLDGQPVHGEARTAVRMLHKPPRVTCTARDPQGKADLRPYLQAMPAGMFPIGRLDRDTTGLLLFTNDGDLANALLRPTHHAPKRYWLWVEELLEPNDPRLTQMVCPNEAFDCAQAVHVHHLGLAGTELHVTLTEGKNRQIRKLCSALQLHLQHLHRFAFGPLTLGNLSSGQMRPLLPAEVAALWNAAGGRGCTEQAQLAALQREAVDLRAWGRPHRRLEKFLAPYQTLPDSAQ